MAGQKQSKNIIHSEMKISFCSWSGLIFSVILVLTGCQKSADQYQEITEEISQPEVDESTSDSEINQTSVNLGKEESSKWTQSGESEKPSPSMTETEVENNSEVDPTPESTAGSTIKSDSPEKVETASSAAEEASSAEKVQSFINLQEEIARQERMDKLGLGQAIKPVEPREPKLLVEQREFSKEKEANAWRVSYDDLDLLKILNMEPVPLNAVDYLPDWLTQLEGEKVILRGWMFPPDRSEGIKGFIFVRDNQVCCFGPNAKAYDKLTVRLKSGTTSKFIQGRPFDVVGTFKIDPWIEDERDLKTGEFVEKVGMLYHLEDAEIVDKK